MDSSRFLAIRDGINDIDFTDFVIGWSHWQDVTEKDKLKLIFEIFDVDGKGNISFHDILRVIGTLHHIEGLEQNFVLERVTLLFSVFEVDPLKHITWRRFQKVIKENKSVTKALEEC